MNIREAETETGLTRANIRFYEKEGLVEPERSDNGYRNYTPENVETLKRIRLLRRLEVPLEQIAKLQKDERTLGQVLAERVDKAGREEEELREQQRICLKIREDGVAYRDLQADIYLREFGKPEDGPAAGYDPVYCDRESRVPQSARRFLARWLDLLLYGLVFDLIIYAVLRIMPREDIWFDILRTASVLILMYVLEPICLHFFGTTTGKYLLGIRICHEDGRRLSVAEGRERTGKVLFFGMGLEIPVFSLYRLWESWRTAQGGEMLPWEGEAVEEADSLNTARVIGAAGVAAVAFTLSFFLTAYAMYPLNRGELTDAELAKNINRYLDYYDLYPQKRLDAECRWQDRPAAEGAYVISVGESSDDYPVLELTEKEGTVTGVSFHVLGDGEFEYGFSNLMKILMRAYGAAQPGMGLKRMNQMEKLVDDHPLESYSETIGEIEVTCTVTYEGYVRVGEEMLHASGDPDRRFELHFSLHKLN